MAPIRAVGLLSGGLDSALAARLLLDQGIEVLGVHLESPTACRSQVREVAGQLGIRLEVRPKGEEYLRLLRSPRYGYGKNMNPCIDCRIFMFQLGRPYMEEFGAQFVFTGEVLGQRPMSQTRGAIALIDRKSGLEGYVLRPLSAHHLAETEPEKRGWVDRARLLGIKGRGRTEQMALADGYGLEHYQAPGGGCLLTDPKFSDRLRDLFDHTPESETTMEDVELLRIGRHVRGAGGVKIVLGRDAAENRRLEELARDRRWIVRPVAFAGPTVLVCGEESEELLAHAIQLLARNARVIPEGAELECGGGRRRIRIDSFPPPRLDGLIQVA